MRMFTYKSCYTNIARDTAKVYAIFAVPSCVPLFGQHSLYDHPYHHQHRRTTNDELIETPAMRTRLERTPTLPDAANRFATNFSILVYVREYHFVLAARAHRLNSIRSAVFGKYTSEVSIIIIILVSVTLWLDIRAFARILECIQDRYIIRSMQLEPFDKSR